MSYMVDKNNPDIYISAFWAIKKCQKNGKHGTKLEAYLAETACSLTTY